MGLILLGFTGLWFQDLSFAWPVIVGGIIIGLFYIVGIYFYYRGLSNEEVSRTTPVFTAIPVFTSIYSILVFAEKINFLNTIGIALIICGITLISYKKAKSKHRAWLSKGIVFTLVGALAFATKNIITKHIAIAGFGQNLLIWVALGCFLGGLILFIQHHPHLRSKMKRQGFRHFFISGFFGVGSALTFTQAVTVGPVSLIGFLERISLPLVFIISLLLNHYQPKILNEHNTPAIIWQKSLAMIIILGGSFLLLQ